MSVTKNSPYVAEAGLEGRVEGEKSVLVLSLLCLCVVLSMTTWFSATAVMPQLQRYWHVTPAESTWLAVSVQLGFAIGAIGSAVISLSDLVPPRVLMAVASAAVAITNFGLLLAPTAVDGIILRTLTGVLLAGVYPPSLKLISTWFRKGRGTALGSVIGALTLGSAMPHAINALGGLDWHIVIVATSAASLIAAILMLLFLRDGPYPFAKATFDPKQIHSIVTDRAFVLCTVGYLGHMWELYAMWSWMLFFVRARLGSGDVHAGSLASSLTFLIIAAGAPACIAAGAGADRIGRTTTTFLMLVISGTCAALIGFTFDGPLWLFLLVGVIWGASVVADSSQFSTIVTEMGDPRLIGTSLTVQLGLGYALTVLAIWLLPAAEHWLGGWQWVFLTLVPGPVIGAVAMARLRQLPQANRIAHGRR
jgi:MFS family permease